MNITQSLICVTLMGVALIGSATGDSQIRPEVVDAILVAAEQVDPVRFKLHDLTNEKRDELIGKVLEFMASQAEKSQTENLKPISRNTEEFKTFIKAFEELSGGRLRDVPMYAGFSPNELLALASVGREHCGKKELKKRRDVCAKLTEKPKYETYCKVAYELIENWCQRPVSIESPFAELRESFSPKAEYSTNFARMRLAGLIGDINYGSVPYQKMLNWQKRENFDRTLEILRRLKNKEELLTGKLSAKDLLALVTIDKSQCARVELEKRRDICRTMSDLNLSAFCGEAYERSVSWCRKSGFVDIPASDQTFWEASTSGTETEMSGDRLHRIYKMHRKLGRNRWID